MSDPAEVPQDNETHYAVWRRADRSVEIIDAWGDMTLKRAFAIACDLAGWGPPLSREAVLEPAAH